MNSMKAAYWFALAIFGFVLHSAYQRGEFPSLHRAAGRASSEFCRLMSHAEQSYAMARLFNANSDRQARIDELMARRQAEIDRMLALRQAELNRAMAMRQADLDRVQQQMEHVRVVMDRTQIENFRGLEHMRIKVKDATNRRMIVVCPETGAKVSVDADADLPEVDVDTDVQ